MKSPQILIPGLLLSICLTSCSLLHRHAAQPEKPAEPPSPPAPRASVSDPTKASAPASVSASPVSLVAFFNVDGIVPNETQFTNGLDGGGFACSSNILGNWFTWKGVPFQLGTANKYANVVSCDGQTIPLPAGKFSKLQILATAVGGAQESQNFVITYTDPSLNQTNTQSVSDWYSPDGNTGESQAIDMDYRDQADGSRDDEPFYIYGYSFDLNPAGTPNSLILTTDENVKVFAITLVL